MGKSEAAKARLRNADGTFVSKHAKLPPNIIPDTDIKHIITYAGIPNLPAHLYRNLDEATRDSRSNSKAMRRDPFILEALFARQMSVAELQYSLEPEDPTDSEQVWICGELKKIVDNIPNRVEWLRNLLEASWYGRYATIMEYGWKFTKGIRRMVVTGWQPLQGDKLVFDYDTGQVGFRVNPARTCGYREVRYSTEGLVEMFNDSEMENVIIHKHFISDAEYDEPEVAVGINGIGLRSQCYWAWVNSKELLGYAFEAFQRMPAGGLLIGYFDASNPASEEAVRTSLQQQQSNNIILFPRPLGNEKAGNGLEILPMNSTGIDTFFKVINDYFGDQIRRLIIGLGLKQNEGAATGIASEYEHEAVARIVKYDASSLGSTLSRTLMPTLLRHNFPGYDFGITFKLHVDKVDPTNFLEACQRSYEIGLDLDAGQVRSVLGLSKPIVGADTLKKEKIDTTQTMRQPISGTQDMGDTL